MIKKGIGGSNTKVGVIFQNQKSILNVLVGIILLASLLMIIGMCVPVGGTNIGKFCEVNRITIFFIDNKCIIYNLTSPIIT